MANSNSADLVIIVTHDSEEVKIPERFVAQFPSINTYLVTHTEDESEGKKFKIPENAPKLKKFNLDVIFGYLEFNEQIEAKQNGEEEDGGSENVNEFLGRYTHDELKETMDVATFLGVAAFIKALAAYFVCKIMEMGAEEMAEFFGADFNQVMRSRFLKWEEEKKLAEEQQRKIDEEKRAKLEAEAEARRLRDEEEEQKRAQENGLDYDDEDHQGINGVGRRRRKK